MESEAKNEALKLIARSLEILNSWEQDSSCRIEDATILLKEAVDKLAQ